jgi:mono/diheme cytochrome c family protein
MFLKILLRFVGLVLLVVVVVLVCVLGYGYSLRHQHVTRRVPAFAAATDSAHVARGAHITQVMCAGCHAPKLEKELTGGYENILAIPKGPTFGMLHGPNLTQGGVLAKYDSDGLLVRALREGVGYDGRALLVMPSAQFQRMSDEDAASVIGYLRSRPAVTSEVPASSTNLLGYLVLGFHVFANSVSPAIASPVPAVPADSSVAYGEYTSYLYGCRDCHGAALHGGKKGQLPPLGPNIAALVQAHPRIDFDNAVRGGVSPTTGKPLDPTLMPWTQFAGLDDVEVSALYSYLRSLK